MRFLRRWLLGYDYRLGRDWFIDQKHVSAIRRVRGQAFIYLDCGLVVLSENTDAAIRKGVQIS